MKLSRTKNRILGGVCGGISKAAKINIYIVRILFVILLFFTLDISVLLVYMALWIIVPTEALESKKKAINNSLDSKIFDRNTSNDIELNPRSTANKVGTVIISIVGVIVLGIYGASVGASAGADAGFTKGSSIGQLPFILIFGIIGLISGAFLVFVILAFLKKKK